ncbi:PREDICTED: protein CutA homolog isoform X2 [Myotis davidii]|uniref:protein CutA homolog isoform X2 n=1 Tax=Myotis davidii TaxID=225400 RepID=UPI000767D7C7|nr:PREDICTED: protein CutA homolog isoform X2 [Myotis davidii]
MPTWGAFWVSMSQRCSLTIEKNKKAITECFAPLLYCTPRCKHQEDGDRVNLLGQGRDQIILTASFLTYPMLRTLSLQLHSAVTGSYVSGTYSIVFVNCPNEQIARDIARAILDKKLAASVNILPKASSLYFWNGEIEEATEILLLIKTKTSKVRMLSSYVRGAK